MQIGGSITTIERLRRGCRIRDPDSLRSVSGWAPLIREWRDAGVTVADACAALHLHLATLLPLVAQAA